jgi:hypothetical protein
MFEALTIIHIYSILKDSFLSLRYVGLCGFVGGEWCDDLCIRYIRHSESCQSLFCNPYHSICWLIKAQRIRNC